MIRDKWMKLSVQNRIDPVILAIEPFVREEVRKRDSCLLPFEKPYK